MPSMLSRAKALVFDVPRRGKLAYCLLRDDRVPAAPKAALLGALGLIVSPIDIPAWIPIFGELDVLALGLLAVETFIEACPSEVRHEHEAAIAANQSVWDRDVRDTSAAARHAAGRFVRQVGARLRRRGAFDSRSEVW